MTTGQETDGTRQALATYVAKDTIITSLVLLIAGLPLAVGVCLDHPEIIAEVEGCLQPLNRYQKGILEGSMTSPEVTEACKDYDKATACLDRLKAACTRPSEHASVEVVESSQNSWAAGMGHVCKNPAKYQGHRICYHDNLAQTTTCLEEHKIIDAECDVLEAQTSCIRTALGSCGQDASRLYQDLVLQAVPSVLVVECLGPVTNKPTATGGATALRDVTARLTLYTSIAATAVASVWLRRHLVVS